MYGYMGKLLFADLTEGKLWEEELLPFRNAVEAGAVNRPDKIGVHAILGNFGEEIVPLQNFNAKILHNSLRRIFIL